MENQPIWRCRSHFLLKIEPFPAIECLTIDTFPFCIIFRYFSGKGKKTHAQNTTKKTLSLCEKTEPKKTSSKLRPLTTDHFCGSAPRRDSPRQWFVIEIFGYEWTACRPVSTRPFTRRRGEGFNDQRRRWRSHSGPHDTLLGSGNLKKHLQFCDDLHPGGVDQKWYPKRGRPIKETYPQLPMGVTVQLIIFHGLIAVVDLRSDGFWRWLTHDAIPMVTMDHPSLQRSQGNSEFHKGNSEFQHDAMMQRK